MLVLRCTERAAWCVLWCRWLVAIRCLRWWRSNSLTTNWDGVIRDDLRVKDLELRWWAASGRAWTCAVAGVATGLWRLRCATPSSRRERVSTIRSCDRRPSNACTWCAVATRRSSGESWRRRGHLHFSRVAVLGRQLLVTHTCAKAVSLDRSVLATVDARSRASRDRRVSWCGIERVKWGLRRRLARWIVRHTAHWRWRDDRSRRHRIHGRCDARWEHRGRHTRVFVTKLERQQVLTNAVTLGYIIRGLAIAVSHSWVRAIGDEELDGLEVALRGGKVERRVVTRARRVHINAAREQVLEDAHTPVVRSCVDRLVTTGVRCVGRHVLLVQHLNELVFLAFFDGRVELLLGRV